MSNLQDPLHPPADNSEVELQKFGVAATLKINALNDSTTALWNMVRAHDKLKTQLLTLGALFLAGVGVIQWAGAMYTQQQIITQLAPLADQVAKINLAMEVSKRPSEQLAKDVEVLTRKMDSLERRDETQQMVLELLKPYPSKIDAMNTRVNLLEDETQQLKSKGKK